MTHHTLVVELVGAISERSIRNPEFVPAYAQTMARRMVYEHIRELIREGRNVDVGSTTWLTAVSAGPEEPLLGIEKKEIANKILSALPLLEQKFLPGFI